MPFLRSKGLKVGCLEYFRFLFEGERIDAKDTPRSLELKDQSVIEAFYKQWGGMI